MTRIDARLFFAIYAAAGGALTGVAQLLSAIGSGWMMLGLVPVYGIARWRRFALGLTLTLATSAAIVFALKAAFGRPRPCVGLPGVHALCATPSDPSFPSGHACGSFTVAAFVIVSLWAEGSLRGASRALVAGVLLALATGIAWSRVYLGVHFPADVVAGALLGAAIGALAGSRLGTRSGAELA